MPRRPPTVPAALSLLAIAVVFASGCADITRDQRAPTANGADRAFVDAMITHHQTTVALARLAGTRAAAPFVRRLGRRVVRGHTDELGDLNAEEESMDIAGVPRAAMPPARGTEDPATARRELTRLRSADAFDLALVTAMIAHQQHTIEMSRFVQTRGRDPQIKRAARRIIRDRQRQLPAMRRFADIQ